MRFEQDFMRMLLARIKEVQWDGGYHDLGIDDRPDRVVSRYIQLLEEAGLIDAADFSTHDTMCWRAKWITEAGERFLRAARNERCWQLAQKIIRRSHQKVTIKALDQALPKARRQLRKKPRIR